MNPQGRPIPAADDPLWAAFYASCVRRELRFQRCERCGRWRHPPRHMCSSCHSTRWTWEMSTGRGRIHSWTVVHQALHPAFAEEVPYAIILAEMEEGVRLIARLRRADTKDGRLALDAPVLVDFELIATDVALPIFSMPQSGGDER